MLSTSIVARIPLAHMHETVVTALQHWAQMFIADGREQVGLLVVQSIFSGQVCIAHRQAGTACTKLQSGFGGFFICEDF